MIFNHVMQLHKAVIIKDRAFVYVFYFVHVCMYQLHHIIYDMI